MVNDRLYFKLSALRDEYRRKTKDFDRSAERAAAIDDMEECSRASTESERYREAFHALNRAIEIVENDAQENF